MVIWLNRALNIRHGEWLRLLLMVLILILTNLGYVWGMNTAYAAFLKPVNAQAGLETLIWVLLLSSVLSIPALGIYSTFSNRIDSNRLYAYMSLGVGLILLACLGLMAFKQTALAFPLLYILIMAYFSILNAHFFTYMNELYDIQTAKRILPLILAAGRTGAILAGFTLQYLTAYLNAEIIILLWLLCDVSVFGLILLIPFTNKEQKTIFGNIVTPQTPASNPTVSLIKIQSLKDDLNFTIQSGFMRWMTIGTLLITVLMTVVEYYTNLLLTPQFNQAAFAGFLGKLDAISNLVALVILLFGISRITKAWGVGNTSLIFPLSTLLSSVGLVISPILPSLFAASFAHINRRGLRIGFQTSDTLLYNAIPFRMKGRARAFVGGLIVPVGAILGVFLLLINKWLGSIFPILVPMMIILLAGAHLLSAIAIRRQYTQALVKMLEEEDYSFLLSQDASSQILVDSTTLQQLQKKLSENTGHEMQIFLTQLITQVAGTEALSILIPTLRAVPEARTRAAMLSILTSASLHDDKSRELYIEFLSDADPQTRQAAAFGLEQLLGSKDPWFQAKMMEMVNDPDDQVALYALHSLANTGQFYKFNQAVQKLDEFIQSASAKDQKNAINILGKIASPQAIEELLVFLESDNDQLRLEAALEMEGLTLPTGTNLDEKILDKIRLLSHDPVACVRQAVLNVLAKFKQKVDHPLLLTALEDKDSLVRTTSVNILVGIGKDIVPILQNELKSSNIQIHKMVTVTLSRIDAKQFGPLVEAEVSNNLNLVYQNISLMQAISEYEESPSVHLLVAALIERNYELVDEIMYLLSAIHGPEMLDIVKESITSDLQVTRNLAIEVLEGLVSPKIAALIASLFDSSTTPKQLIQLGHETLNIEQMDVVTALEKLLVQTEPSILAQLAIQALGDVGVKLSKSEVVAKTEPNNITKPGVSRLLQVLESTTQLLNPTKPGEPKSITHILFQQALNNPDPFVQQAAQASLKKITTGTDEISSEADVMQRSLTQVERILLLKEVPFFQNIPVQQLEMLASICKENRYIQSSRIFKQGDPGGVLCIIIKGQVAIEQENRSDTTLFSNLGNGDYFGEMSLFDLSPHSASVIAMQDCLILELNRDPIVALTMQYPNIALEFINVLSRLIRKTSDRIADATPSRPRKLHKLFDEFV